MVDRLEQLQLSDQPVQSADNRNGTLSSLQTLMVSRYEALQMMYVKIRYKLVFMLVNFPEKDLLIFFRENGHAELKSSLLNDYLCFSLTYNILIPFLRGNKREMNHKTSFNYGKSISQNHDWA